MKSQLHIIAGFKNGKTYLQHAYCEQPFKLANITEDTSANLLKLMLMSSSPGILDNDNLEIDINIEAHAKMQLTTQGYQRIFTMKSSATQNLNVHVQDHGSFYFLPHPSVPHTSSNYSATNNIYLCQSHSLIFSEIITCGRKLSGEEFLFTRLHSVTNIYLDKKLVVKENVLIEPLTGNIHAIGQLEGYTHQSTLLYIDDSAGMNKISDTCKEELSTIKEITFGISKLNVNGLIIRILGHKGEKLFLINNRLAQIFQQHQNSISESGILTTIAEL